MKGGVTINYINKITTELSNTNNITEIKKILCEIFVRIQMDSGIREEFEGLIIEMIRMGKE